MDMLLDLPEEILLMIFGHLYSVDDNFKRHGRKSDVLSCRLACRRLANTGQQVAFNHIEFVQGEIGFKRLIGLSRSPLRNGVRRLSCYFEVFDARRAASLEAFTAGLGRLNECLSPLKINKWFEKYRRGNQYQDLLELDSRHLASLANALAQFQNLRSVRILQTWEHSLYRDEDDGMGSPTESSTSPVGHQLFEAIADALAASENGVEELTLGNFYPEFPMLECHGLVSTIQGLAPAICQKYLRAFGKLKRLEIALPWILADGESLNFSGLSALIRSAIPLEELGLSFMFPSIPSLPPHFLRSVEVPKLRTLILNSATFQEPGSLLAFLGKHAVTLRNVQFYELCLEGGSWETVFVGMRDILALKSSVMVGFKTRYDGPEEEICPWEDCRAAQFHQAIDDFIQRETDVNPFDLLRNS